MNLTTILEQSNLDVVERKSIAEKFSDYESIAKEWENKAKTIVVTDASQTTEMAMAKEARKKFSQLRIDVEKTRKQLKEQSLRKGQAIDAIAKFLTSLVVPIEQYLKEQECFVQIQEEKKALELKIAEEKRLAEEEARRVEAEKKEQEKIKAENDRLRLEAEKREKEIAEERAKQQKLLEEERQAKEKLEAELKAKKDAEEKAKKDQEEVEKKKKEEEAKKDDMEKFNSYVNKLLQVEAPQVTDVEVQKQLKEINRMLINLIIRK